jgi:hypothetical protein
VTCTFSFDDGAYILGALAPGERAEYERHLSTCDACRQAVANLAVLPGLLGRLDTERALPDVRAPATLLPRILATAAARRRAAERTERLRRRWFTLAAGVVAVCLATVVGVAVHRADTTADIGPGIALTAMRPAGATVPISAEVGLIAVPGGTRVEMRCRYTKQFPGHWTVRMVVYPRSGIGMDQISTWMAEAGEEYTISAVTHLLPAEIAKVELHSDDHNALLTWIP